jgi:N-dimethylarginine dimethylaminohydrolase
MNEFGRIARLVLKHPRQAFENAGTVARQWRDLNFTGAPDFALAMAQYDRLVDLLRQSGAEIEFLPMADGTTLDSIYVRDASLVSPAGMILCAMGKAQRSSEPGAQAQAFERIGLPIAGAIRPPGLLEGGDVVWLDERTIVVGRGYRTNDHGIRQLRDLLDARIDVVVVPLPHYRGPTDVFHLMSIISPVDVDLSVVYSPLMPVPFREYLLERGMQFVEVPADEFDTMGANVLAIAPRQCVMVAGNPKTRAELERAGAQVFEYEGTEISLKGGGGPTCLTRPITRHP